MILLDKCSCFDFVDKEDGPKIQNYLLFDQRLINDFDQAI